MRIIGWLAPYLWPPASTPPLSTVPPIGLGAVSAASSRRSASPG